VCLWWLCALWVCCGDVTDAHASTFLSDALYIECCNCQFLVRMRTHHTAWPTALRHTPPGLLHGCRQSHPAWGVTYQALENSSAHFVTPAGTVSSRINCLQGVNKHTLPLAVHSQPFAAYSTAPTSHHSHTHTLALLTIKTHTRGSLLCLRNTWLAVLYSLLQPTRQHTHTDKTILATAS
jgi:hypothetical protein